MTTPAVTPTQITLDGASVRFADRIVLDRVDLIIRPGERVGVVGDNGSGKSTLLAVLSGRLAPTAGQRRVEAPAGIVHVGRTLDLPPATTVQQVVDHLLADLRSLEAELRATEVDMGRAREIDLPPLLARYAALAAAYDARRCSTSHLSPTLVDELEQGLDGCPGTVVVVTHDRRLQERLGSRELRLPHDGRPVAARELFMAPGADDGYL